MLQWCGCQSVKKLPRHAQLSRRSGVYSCRMIKVLVRPGIRGMTRCLTIWFVITLVVGCAGIKGEKKTTQAASTSVTIDEPLSEVALAIEQVVPPPGGSMEGGHYIVKLMDGRRIAADQIDSGTTRARVQSWADPPLGPKRVTGHASETNVIAEIRKTLIEPKPERLKELIGGYEAKIERLEQSLRGFDPEIWLKAFHETNRTVRQQARDLREREYPSSQHDTDREIIAQMHARKAQPIETPEAQLEYLRQLRSAWQILQREEKARTAEIQFYTDVSSGREAIYSVEEVQRAEGRIHSLTAEMPPERILQTLGLTRDKNKLAKIRLAARSFPPMTIGGSPDELRIEYPLGGGYTLDLIFGASLSDRGRLIYADLGRARWPDALPRWRTVTVSRPFLEVVMAIEQVQPPLIDKGGHPADPDTVSASYVPNSSYRVLIRDEPDPRSGAREIYATNINRKTTQLQIRSWSKDQEHPDLSRNSRRSEDETKLLSKIERVLRVPPTDNEVEQMVRLNQARIEPLEESIPGLEKLCESALRELGGFESPWDWQRRADAIVEQTYPRSEYLRDLQATRLMLERRKAALNAELGIYLDYMRTDGFASEAIKAKVHTDEVRVLKAANVEKVLVRIPGMMRANNRKWQEVADDGFTARDVLRISSLLDSEPTGIMIHFLASAAEARKSFESRQNYLQGNKEMLAGLGDVACLIRNSRPSVQFVVANSVVSIDCGSVNDCLQVAF